MNFNKRFQAVHDSATEPTCGRVFVAKRSANRKVLIVKDDPAINNLLTLIRRLDSRGVAVANSRIDLFTLNRRSFDTAILDLRCSQAKPAGKGCSIGEVWPNMVGKVLVINAEVNDQRTFQSVEQYIYHRHTAEGLLFDVGRLVRSLFGRSPSPSEI